MKKNWRRGIAAGLAGMLIVLAAGCGAAADSAVPEGQEQEMPGTGGTVSADKAGNSAAEIPTPDPEKRYQILRMISKLMIPVLIFLLVFLPRILSLFKDDLLNAAVSLLGLAGFAAYLIYLAILYKNYD